MPEPVHERPSYKKKRARQLLHEAARLADASTLDDGQRAEIACMRDEAEGLLQERKQQLMNLERAATHPATHHTAAAWGAQPGEPLPFFSRALRKTLLELGVSQDKADQLVDAESDKGQGKKGGKKGGEKGGKKGGKGEDKGKR